MRPTARSISVTICVALLCDAVSPFARAQAQAPVAPVPASTQSPAPANGVLPWPWIAFGLGGVGLGVGTVTGVLALENDSQSVSPHTVGLISVGSFVAAGVCSAAGITLLLLQPAAGSTPATSGLRIVPVLEPGSVGVVGQFW